MRYADEKHYGIWQVMWTHYTQHDSQLNWFRAFRTITQSVFRRQRVSSFTKFCHVALSWIQSTSKHRFITVIFIIILYTCKWNLPFAPSVKMPYRSLSSLRTLNSLLLKPPLISSRRLHQTMTKDVNLTRNRETETSAAVRWHCHLFWLLRLSILLA
jgi:hypothetical protein